MRRYGIKYADTYLEEPLLSPEMYWKLCENGLKSFIDQNKTKKKMINTSFFYDSIYRQR